MYEQTLAADRAAAHYSELGKVLLFNGLIAVWVLVCYLVPKYFLQSWQRKPNCDFKAIRANIYFAALISVTFFSHICYLIKIACCR